MDAMSIMYVKAGDETAGVYLFDFQFYILVGE